MAKKYLKKIIAQSAQDLKVISACCEGGKIKIDDIKYLPKNKIFLFLIERIAREKENSKEIVKSIVKFEYIGRSKSKNIDNANSDSFIELLTINLFRIFDCAFSIFYFSINILFKIKTYIINFF